MRCPIEPLLSAVFDMAILGVDRFEEDAEGARRRLETIESLIDMAIVQGGECIDGCFKCVQLQKAELQAAGKNK